MKLLNPAETRGFYRLIQHETACQRGDTALGAGPVGSRVSLYDGHGLHLINRGGRHHWRLKYTRLDECENRLAFAHYPEVGLAEARQLSLDTHAMLHQGIDPTIERKAVKTKMEVAATRTFAVFARKWLDLKFPGWSPVTTRKDRRSAEAYLSPNSVSAMLRRWRRMTYRQ